MSGVLESAFNELVLRYIDLVYSAAIRQVSGDAQLAKDVSQTVFIALVKKARELSKGVVLGGWLYRHTCFVAAQTFGRKVVGEFVKKKLPP